MRELQSLLIMETRDISHTVPTFEIVYNTSLSLLNKSAYELTSLDYGSRALRIPTQAASDENDTLQRGNLTMSVKSDFINILLYGGLATGILSILVNLLSLIAMHYLKDKPTADLRFLTNLSLTDLLAALSFVIIQFTPSYDINTDDLLVPVISYVLRSSPWMFLTAYLLTVTSLSVNQYLAVCKPWRYSVIVTRRRITVVLACLWVVSGLQILVPVLVVSAQILLKNSLNKLGRYLAYVSAIETQVWMSIFTLIITANVILNALVYRQIRALKKRLANRPDSENIRIKQRAFITISYLLITGIFLWIPFPLMGILSINIEMRIDGFTASLIGVTLNLLLYINCLADPLIYGSRVIEVRQAYKAMFVTWGQRLCPGTCAHETDSPSVSQTVMASPCKSANNTVQVELCTYEEEGEVLI